MIMNNKVEEKELIFAYVKILFQYSPWNTAECMKSLSIQDSKKVFPECELQTSL
jgi:hypothetical protein